MFDDTGGYHIFELQLHQVEIPALNGWFPEMGKPQNGWFIREHATEMDDLGRPLFQEIIICFILRTAYISPDTL